MELKPKNAEIIVGIVAPIGTDRKAVIKCVHDELMLYGYNVTDVRLTSLIDVFVAKFNENNISLVQSPTEARYESYIKACNKLRSDLGDEIMATLAISEISSQGKKKGASRNIETRNAYIVNQIKRPEEFEVLRSVYGEHYVQISCYEDEEKRVNRLAKDISRDHHEKPKDREWDIEARKLVSVDESEENETHGQRVQKVFPLSDVIVNSSSKDRIKNEIERFFRALFGDNSITPTKEEYGMELANTAAERSSDLSRQVGAAILTKDMTIKALGCNEVPKAMGGTYWADDPTDGRDFTKGEDANHSRREAVLLDLVSRLKKIGALSEEYTNSENIRALLLERPDGIIKDSQLMDSLEYGRTVHAEMNAITDAARSGQGILDCRLYSNTFPCHNCTKHIVASGISEVIYIYPYPKSYSKELFDDSICINPTSKLENKVVFKQFIGITGPMYARVFTKARWEREKGNIKEFTKKDASFIRRTPIPSYPETERYLFEELYDKLKNLGYMS